ncbi:MAG: non-homologous end-joining DNA ligase [Patescibacteria group bacterium]|nr:non-homologous end-joining DNA ligase [Patescibacteria group bacterium]
MLLKFTHLDKIFWPKEQYTKGDVLAYYEKIAPYMLPYLKDRPLVLNRHPNGIEGKNFYQKDTSREHLPPFITTTAIRAETTGERVQYIVCNNKDTLLWAANFGCIEMNPWQSRLRQGSGGQTRLNYPDYVTIDLDPHGRSFDDVVEVALGFKKILEKARVKSLIKTSGKTGMHLMIPLGARYTYLQARSFAKLLVACANKEMPKLTTLEQRLNKRKGKIYLDIARNAPGQTTACVYSLRPYPGATVSTPLDWREVKKGLRPSQFTIKTIFPRLKKKGDLMKGLLSKGAYLNKATKKLEKELEK